MNWNLCHRNIHFSCAISLYFRLQKALDQSLKQSVETRWNTRLAMLQSVNDALRSGRLHDILLRQNELRYLNNIDCELLEDIIQLLKPFDEATRHLSTDQTPTLHLVLPTKATLLRGLSIQDGDSVIVKEVIQYISDFHLVGGHSSSKHKHSAMMLHVSSCSSSPS